MRPIDRLQLQGGAGCWGALCVGRWGYIRGPRLRIRLVEGRAAKGNSAAAEEEEEEKEENNGRDG